MIALLLVGCGLISPPSARVQGVSITSLGMTEASLEVALALHNPVWVDVHVERLRWSFDVAGTAVAAGDMTVPVVLAANATTLVPVPVDLRYADLYTAIGATFSGDVIPYRMVAELDTITPTGPATVPLVYEGQLPGLRPPRLELVQLDYGVDDDGRLRIDLGLHLDLPERFAVNRLDWFVDVDHRRIGEGSVTVDADGTLRVPVTFDAMGAAGASWDWLWGASRALRLSMTGQVVTPLGTAPIALDRSIALQDHGTPPSLPAQGG